MKRVLHIFSCFFLLSFPLASQTEPFRENSKWGIKENETVIVAPVYDTVFNFDASGKVCLACFKSSSASANRFIKTITTSYSCNYLNRDKKRLFIRAEGNDSCSVFTLQKATVKAYNDRPSFFTVSVKNKKHLVGRDFTQLTFKGYYDIVPAPDANYYIAQEVNEGGVVLTGLIDLKEKEIIPFNYSDIKMNRYDSLIVCCSAGIRNNGTDDVFDYSGKKTESFHRHVDLATKNFIIHKVFEPKEYYIIYNLENREEKNLNADGIQPSLHDEILMRVKSDWFIYDLKTNLKKPLKSS